MQLARGIHRSVNFMNSNVSLCNFRNEWARINWWPSVPGNIGNLLCFHGALFVFIHKTPQFATNWQQKSLSMTVWGMGITRIFDDELTQHQMIQTHVLRGFCFLFYSVSTGRKSLVLPHRQCLSKLGQSATSLRLSVFAGVTVSR